MATPKQTENEDKFLKPALGELQPYYADLFDCIMRGKKRGDGLMIDPERKDEIESHIYDLEDTRKKERRKIKEEERRKLYEQETRLSEDEYLEKTSYGTDTVWLYKLEKEGIITEKRKKELKSRLQERMSKRSNEMTEIADKDVFLSEAYYVLNTIQSDDRGTMNIKAKFGSLTKKSPVMMEKRSEELRAVAEIFEKYRSSTENPDVTANEKTIKVAENIYGDGIAERMKEKKQKQQEFVNQEVIA